MKTLLIASTVVTKETAKDFLKNMIQYLMIEEFTVDSSLVLSDMEEKLVNAGFFTWEKIESLEAATVNKAVA